MSEPPTVAQLVAELRAMKTDEATPGDAADALERLAADVERLTAAVTRMAAEYVEPWY